MNSSNNKRNTQIHFSKIIKEKLRSADLSFSENLQNTQSGEEFSNKRAYFTLKTDQLTVETNSSTKHDQSRSSKYCALMRSAVKSQTQMQTVYESF